MKYEWFVVERLARNLPLWRLWSIITWRAYEKSATWSLSGQTHRQMIIGTRVFSKPDLKDIWPHGNCLWKIYSKAGLRESGKEPPVSEAKCRDFDFHFIVQAFRKLSSQFPIRLLTPVILNFVIRRLSLNCYANTGATCAHWIVFVPCQSSISNNLTPQGLDITRALMFPSSRQHTHPYCTKNWRSIVSAVAVFQSWIRNEIDCSQQISHSRHAQDEKVTVMSTQISKHFISFSIHWWVINASNRYVRLVVFKVCLTAKAIIQVF